MLLTHDDVATLRSDLGRLVESQAGPCASLYMPTHRAGPEVRQNPIRLKNLLRQAEERLIAVGVRAAEAREQLRPASELLDDATFWEHQSDGLALFLAPNAAYIYRLPLRFDELVVVAGRFHLKPLFPLLSGDGEFYILALSQNTVRLLHGTRHTVSELDLAGVPRSLAEAMRYEEPVESAQYHTRAPAGRDKRALVFHGHGVGEDDEKDRILRYFRQIDAGLRELLAGQRAPLVLAGVDYLLPIYREANTYPYLLEEGVTGSPDRLRADELHAQAWEIVGPHFERTRQASLARYGEYAAKGLASHRLEEIVPAAHHGRVDTLFVAIGEERWGVFDPTTNTVSVRSSMEAGDGDLLDFAAIRTLANGGTVYAVEPSAVPNGGPAAAIFRY
jgi:hypothetical protein